MGLLLLLIGFWRGRGLNSVSRGRRPRLSQGGEEELLCPSEDDNITRFRSVLDY